MYSTVVADEGEVFGVRTREGTAYYMTRINDTAVIDKAKIVQQDLQARDAVVHVIDRVILPTSGKYPHQFAIHLPIYKSPFISYLT